MLTVALILGSALTVSILFTLLVCALIAINNLRDDLDYLTAFVNQMAENDLMEEELDMKWEDDHTLVVSGRRKACVNGG